MAGLNLVEAAKLHALNGDYKKAGLIMAFAEGTPVGASLPVFTMGQGSGSSYGWIEEGVLATAAFRALNSAGYTAGEGKSTPRSVPLKIAGGLCQVDRATIQMMGEDKRRAVVVLSLIHI